MNHHPPLGPETRPSKRPRLGADTDGPSPEGQSPLPPFENSPVMEPLAGGDPGREQGPGASPSRPAPSKPSISGWPPKAIPVEIFDIITSYLRRRDVQNMRLVNLEFEEKVSAKYFKNVVVPFKAELYAGLGDAKKSPSKNLFPTGLRVFQSFGHHILRFALSLELDEEVLAQPPPKANQKAVPTFWGIYRWPHENYHRYHELEGLEQTADETEMLKHALRFLDRVTALGLCCDAGLGYLLGPDRDPEMPIIPSPVFTAGRGPRYQLESLDASHLRKHSGSKASKHKMLKQMVMNAGYSKTEADDAIRVMLQTEGSSLSSIDLDERAQTSAIGSLPEAGGHQEYDPMEDLSLYPVQVYLPASPMERMNFAQNCALQPRYLTKSQKEMLLELEWAHRALIQSYVIAVIDNARHTCFAHLTSLNIAKIPSSHIPILYRTDFWTSIPGLTSLSLGVIPDWRRIQKTAPGCVDDIFVSPLEAVGKVFVLLQEHVARLPNITHLHFEWVCGGEFASGVTHRNRHILPAPFVHNAEEEMLMANGAFRMNFLLCLPHIEHLSLKNCWSTPHIFLQTIRQLALESLRVLELETFSLTGPPTRHGQPPPNAQQQALLDAMPSRVPNGMHPNFQAIAAGVPQPQVMQAQPAAPAPAHPAPAPAPAPVLAVASEVQTQNGPLRLIQPSLLSWGGIIEHFSPGVKIRRLLKNMGESGKEDTDTSDDDDAFDNVNNDENVGIGGNGLNPNDDDDDDENDGAAAPNGNAWLDNTNGGVANGAAAAGGGPGLGAAMVPGANPNAIPPQENPRTFLPRPEFLESNESMYSLTNLSFKSCGYAVIDGRFVDVLNIVPQQEAWAPTPDTLRLRRHLEKYMLPSTDQILARALNYLRPLEKHALMTAWGFQEGWQIYDDLTIAGAVSDGVRQPGIGRFTGTISAEDRRQLPEKSGAVPSAEELDAQDDLGNH